MSDETSVSTEEQVQQSGETSKDDNNIAVVSSASNGDNPQNDSHEEVNAQSTWWWDDKTPGNGEKPEWFDEKKYKTIQDQAKGLPGIRKILGEHDGAPDEYEVNISEDLKKSGLEIDKEDLLIKQFSEIAKETHMSQRAFDKVVNMYLENYKQSLPSQEEIEQAYQEEFKEAGGIENLKKLEQWGENNLPENMFEAFKESVVDAKSAKLFMFIRDNLIQKDAVPTGSTNENSFQSKEALRNMLKDKRALSDPEFQKEINKKYINFYKN